MNDPQTCGKGLAEHAVLPGKIGELMDSVADNLDLHTRALEVEDANSRREFDVYVDLVREHHAIANRLQALATRMAGYRDLPMGRHDLAKISGPRVADAYEKFVRIEQDLLLLLQRRLEQDRKMLVQMRGAG